MIKLGTGSLKSYLRNWSPVYLCHTPMLCISCFCSVFRQTSRFGTLHSRPKQCKHVLDFSGNPSWNLLEICSVRHPGLCRTVRCSSGRWTCQVPVRTGHRNYYTSSTTSSGISAGPSPETFSLCQEETTRYSILSDTCPTWAWESIKIFLRWCK